MVVFFFKRSNG